MSTADLSVATREFIERGVKKQVFMRTPVLEELMRRNQVTISGGTTIDKVVDKAEMTELGQAYTANTALTDEKKNMLARPSFEYKLYQVPLRYDVDEELQNIEGAAPEQIVNLAQHLADKGMRAAKLGIQRMMFNVDPDTGSGSETGRATTSKYFHSLLTALDHTVTSYGGITRGWSTNDWFMGGDPEGSVTAVSSSSQGTAYSLSIANLRKWRESIEQYMESMQDLYIVMGPTLFNKLRAEMESHLQGSGKLNMEKLQYGVSELELDGSKVVSCPFLKHGYGTSGTTENWVFMLNLADWELVMHKARNFKATDYKWQGENSNGYDRYLARILIAGNLLCWKPNGSMWLNNVS